MESCELLPQCTFHACLAKRRPYAVKHLEEDYCNAEYSICVRYMIYRVLGLSLIPSYLLPWDIREARRFLESVIDGG